MTHAAVARLASCNLLIVAPVIETRLACIYLETLGTTIIGPLIDMDAASSAIERGVVDAAILEPGLPTEAAMPVALLLTESSIPFVFATSAPPQSPDLFAGYVFRPNRGHIEKIAVGLFGSLPTIVH